jgi:long-chain acyl-CoA synthetase
VPVNPTSTSGELARMLADSGARLAVGDPDTVTALRAGVAEVRRALRGEPSELSPDLLSRAAPAQVVVVGVPAETGERSLDDLRGPGVGPGTPVPGLLDTESLAVLLYTSGTSGRPRAAMLTHRALLANIAQVSALEPPMIGADDVVLGVLPLFHVYGLNAVLGVVLDRGATLVLVERFDPAATLEVIRQSGCTVLPVAPAAIGRWLSLPDPAQLAAALSRVRLVVSGSAPLAPEDADRFTGATGLAVHQGYGLTEAAPVVTSTLVSRTLQPWSVGAALPGIVIRLADEFGAVPEGEDPGEIWVLGPNLFSGYWPDGADGPSEDGWWATGDVGFLDPSGDLFLVDRVKELVIVSGFNVYPREVEEVVREVPGVGGVGVIGVPDPETGEAVVAYVVARGHDPEALAEAVRRRCAERLARFKRPTRVEVVDELPLTVTGKVQKGRLRNAERRRTAGLLE